MPLSLYHSTLSRLQFPRIGISIDVVASCCSSPFYYKTFTRIQTKEQPTDFWEELKPRINLVPAITFLLWHDWILLLQLPPVSTEIKGTSYESVWAPYWLERYMRPGCAMSVSPREMTQILNWWWCSLLPSEGGGCTVVGCTVVYTQPLYTTVHVRWPVLGWLSSLKHVEISGLKLAECWPGLTTSELLKWHFWRN